MTTPRVGPRALALIESFEGCRLHAYPDTGGVMTCGRGSTGPDIHAGTVWTQTEADTRFAADIQRFAGYVVPLLHDAPTTPAQYGAFVSAAYNAGPGNLAKSPMLAAHRTGDTADAAKAWRDWHIHDHAGNVEPGLIRRRAAEADLYLTGVTA